jgi:hypothetical protein
MNLTADIVMVGAGIVDAACAMELATEKFGVTVVHGSCAGSGATAAGVGHIVVMDDSEAQFTLPDIRWRCGASGARNVLPIMNMKREAAQAYSLRPERHSLAQPDTWICRGEDVSLERLHPHGSWRAAKLHTHCGRGPCQGRICGATLEFLLGWNTGNPRAPVFPVNCASVAALRSAHDPIAAKGPAQ